MAHGKTAPRVTSCCLAENDHGHTDRSTPRSSSAKKHRRAQVDHLPIIAHYARRLGLVEMINGLVPVEMEVEPGMIALGLVLDTLSRAFTAVPSGKSV